MTSVCERCIQGYILDGQPSGVFEGPAYFKAAPVPSKRAVIVLTDIFGLKVPNSKLLADRYSEKLGCDLRLTSPSAIGNPPFTPEQLAPVVHDVPNTSTPFLAKIKFVATIFTSLPALMRIRFARRIKLEKKYDKIGVIGFCFGGAQVIRLASTDLFDSAIVAHPGPTGKKDIQAMKIPTSWICAEEDNTFPPSLRQEAESIFRRKHEIDKLEYEFKDYKGTVHGFAARPNLSIPVVKDAFEAAFEQTVSWFNKTLPVEKTA
ncbi:hypothetical protein Clacol_002709 [Clathrus columnatus]|uniref:Dienelactone hydrolase domain-containing protein n=1 Tax=Clathrus columnatus TaxID=1419009 RepID=A0AAV5A1G4_9AGAM|nr:hypothetical protein Clacol_002709 [Clathrus columnatus]